MNIVFYTLILSILLLSLLCYHFYPRSAKIIVSLTTSPKRIDKIKPVLDSIMAQTCKPDRIVLNLPRVFKRTGDTFSKPLPSFIKNNPIVHVNWCEDIGPATKIIPTVYLIKDPNTYILSIDDDIYYPKNLLKMYIAYSKIFENAIITGTTFIDNTDRLDNKWLESIKLRKLPRFSGRLADLLEGFSGVLYRRDFFTKELLKDFYKWNEEKSCRLGDDFYLSNLFKKYRRKIVCLKMPVSHNHFNPDTISPLDYGLQPDALHKRKEDHDNQNFDGNHNNYRNCTKILNENGELYIDYFMPS